jgi:hypothetical protein
MIVCRKLTQAEKLVMAMLITRGLRLTDREWARFVAMNEAARKWLLRAEGSCE